MCRPIRTLTEAKGHALAKHMYVPHHHHLSLSLSLNCCAETDRLACLSIADLLALVEVLVNVLSYDH